MTNASDVGRWAGYRLGDFVKGGRNFANLAIKGYPSSIGAEYKKIKPAGYSKELFCDIVKRRQKKAIEAGSIDPPLPADVVVHLRLGDTHGKFQAGELNDIWDHGVSLIPLEIRNMIGIRRRELGWWHYIKTKCDYEDILKLIPNYTKRVILVGSSHHNAGDQEKNNSIAYVDRVRRFFEDSGYTTCIRPQIVSPDDDLIWMISASIVVSSGGGYSMLIRDCAAHLNRSVLKEGNGAISDGSCWKVPAPEIVYERNYSWETTGWQGRGGPWDGNKTYIKRNSTVSLWGERITFD